MIINYGGIYFNDVNGDVWEEELQPYDAFKDIWDVDRYEEYREEFMRLHGYYDDEEEGDPDAEDLS